MLAAISFKPLDPWESQWTFAMVFPIFMICSITASFWSPSNSRQTVCETWVPNARCAPAQFIQINIPLDVSLVKSDWHTRFVETQKCFMLSPVSQQSAQVLFGGRLANSFRPWKVSMVLHIVFVNTCSDSTRFWNVVYGFISCWATESNQAQQTIYNFTTRFETHACISSALALKCKQPNVQRFLS